MYKTTHTNENRSLRDELLFAHNIKKQFQIPKDITNIILYQSYILRDINTIHYKHGQWHAGSSKSEQLQFNQLGKNAIADFLYLTNKEEINFLKMEPFICQREKSWSINIVVTHENNEIYKTLPQNIKRHTWWFIKEYDD